MNKIDIIKALLNEDIVKNESIKPDKEIIGTKKQIVILNRGWVVVGDYTEDDRDGHLTNASIIRVWGTTKGIGELAENGPTSSTKLDSCPDIHFNLLTTVARLDVNNKNWK